MTLMTLQTYGENTKKEESITEVKSKIIEMLDKRISKIEEEKTCVNAAKSKEDLRNCRTKMKEEMHKMRSDKRAKMQEKKSTK